MATDPGILVRLVHAHADHVWQQSLRIAHGSTVAQAIALSRFAMDNPDYPAHDMRVGIFGQQCDPQRVLADMDRIEIYRALVFDPMESRRRREAHRLSVAKRRAKA